MQNFYNSALLHRVDKGWKNFYVLQHIFPIFLSNPSNYRLTYD